MPQFVEDMFLDLYVVKLSYFPFAFYNSRKLLLLVSF